MVDNSGITERKGKKGLSLQIQLKYDTETGRKTFTKTIKVNDYPDKKSAYVVARMIRDKARIDIATEKIIDKKVPTVEWFFNKEEELLVSSIKTKSKHQTLYNSCIIQFADTSLDKVKTSDIQHSLMIYAETHSQDCVNRAISLWRAIYHVSAMLEYEVSDKTLALTNIKSKIVSTPRNTDITIESFNDFCVALLNYNLKDGKPCKMSLDTWYMLQIMRYTGCRTAEVLALNASDFDKDNKILHINKSVGSTSKETRQIITTKTIESIRDVPLTEECVTILNSLLEYSNTTPLLCDEDGKPYEISYISSHISFVSKKCGIKFNAYMLRHLFSTTLFRKGINQAIIRDLMGHTTSTISLGYANTSSEDREKAIESIK